MSNNTNKGPGNSTPSSHKVITELPRRVEEPPEPPATRPSDGSNYFPTQKPPCECIACMLCYYTEERQTGVPGYECREGAEHGKSAQGEGRYRFSLMDFGDARGHIDALATQTLDIHRTLNLAYQESGNSVLRQWFKSQKFRGAVFDSFRLVQGGNFPSWNGTSGIHNNMTNARTTDPESLERLYPVVLRRFCFREGSGGQDAFCGGEGVIRDVEFRLPMSASILSERRSYAPYGMEGGSDGGRGYNTWMTTSGQQISMGGKSSVPVDTGDRVVIETPGGGGYGVPTGDSRAEVMRETSFIPLAGGSIQEIKDIAEQV